MRRLPVFFVLDVSESMVGRPLKQMEEGLERIVNRLRQDPHALETVHISVIAFAGKADALTPLVDLMTFYPPKLPVGAGTAFGEALTVLMKHIDDQVKQTTADVRGDWKPVVFLITDGKPTDHPEYAIQKWCDEYKSKCSLVAITLGMNADMLTLSKVADSVLALETTGDTEFTAFIDWVSQSMSMQSVHVESAGKGVSLEKPELGGLTLVENVSSFHTTDPDYVVLTGRCSKNKDPYLMKYARVNNQGMERFIKDERFHFEGMYALDDNYFNWSAKGAANQSVNVSLLEGGAGCPHCGNPCSFAMCGCGKLLCIDATGEVNCPWCAKALQFDMFAGGGSNDFDVVRGQG